MASSKHARRTSEAEHPDAAAFVRVLDESGIDPAIISAAYEKALSDWSAGRTYAERFTEATSDGGIVKDRPKADRSGAPTPEAVMVAVHRDAMWRGVNDTTRGNA